ncbi:MAG: hypothetical protein ACE368_07580 [Paracoccaceae bacterium]
MSYVSILNTQLGFKIKRSKRNRILFSTTAGLALLASVSASAQQWNGGNGDWNVAGNWTPAAVPDNPASVVNFVAGAGTVDLGGGTFDVGTMNVGGTYGIDNGTLGLTTGITVTNVVPTTVTQAGATVLLRGDAQIATQNADATFLGAITNSAASTLTLDASGGTTLQIDGIISDGANPTAVVVGSGGAGVVQLNGVNTFTGGTDVTAGGTLQNGGTVGAVGVQAGGTLTNSGTAGAVTNAGTVGNTGTIASVTQSGGTTTVSGTGTVTGLSDINGGTFDHTSTGASGAVQNDTGTVTVSAVRSRR